MDPDDTTITVEDNDITPPVVTQVAGGEIMVNLESMIKASIAAIERSNIEAKKLKEMLDDILNNNPQYADAVEKTKEASKVKQKARADVLKQPQAKDLDDKIKNLRGEIKEAHGSLSDYLQEYQRMSGVNEIEVEDEVREIVYTAKLIKKNFSR